MLDDLIPGPPSRNARFRQAVERVARAARSDVPVLLAGESGVGKEVLARALHAASRRRNAAYVAVNAAALPETLLESELFGHERGAFTGADRPRPGLFRDARGGTVLVDEIGDLPVSLQAKLLRVLQEGEVRPVGGTRSIPVDVRVVTATHRDLRALVAAGGFREDLFYRVSVFVVEIPPLRARSEDIVPLAEHFLARHAPPGTAPPRLGDSARRCLRSHPWPGNVRELENACRHALVLAPQAGPVEIAHLPAGVAKPEERVRPALTLKALRDGIERRRILEALEAAGGNRTQAARWLGVSRQGLHGRLRRLGIGPGAGRSDGDATGSPMDGEPEGR